ncbi:hypothetical protein [Methanobrevibacter sp.]|uniref:hypothetical protein n=1 Tax=Methanobrevibacter sp. TaxID=66852 RepID=UPI00388EA735
MIIELEGKLLTQATIIARLKGVELEKYVATCVANDVEESKKDLFKLFDEPVRGSVEKMEVKKFTSTRVRGPNHDPNGPLQAYQTHDVYRKLIVDDDMIVWNETQTGNKEVLPLWQFIYVCEVFKNDNKMRYTQELAKKFGVAPTKTNRLGVEFLEGHVDDFLKEQNDLLLDHTFGKHGNELYIDGERTRLNLQEVRNIVCSIQDSGLIGKSMYYFVEEWNCRAIDVLPQHVVIICANYDNSQLINLLNLGGGNLTPPLSVLVV